MFVLHTEQFVELLYSLFPSDLELRQVISNLSYVFDLLVFDSLALVDLRIQKLVGLLFVRKQRLCSLQMVVTFSDQEFLECVLQGVKCPAQLGYFVGLLLQLH